MKVVRGHHDREGYMRIELDAKDLARLNGPGVAASVEDDGTRVTVVADEPALNAAQHIGAASEPDVVGVARARPGFDWEQVDSFACTGREDWTLDEALDWGRDAAREGIGVQVRVLYRAKNPPTNLIVCRGCTKPKPQISPGWRLHHGAWWCPDCRRSQPGETTGDAA